MHFKDLRVCNSEVADLSNDWDEMEWQGLRTLLSLQLSSLPKLVSLPMGLQYVSSLQNLEISFSPILKSQVYTQPSNKKIQNPYSFSFVLSQHFTVFLGDSISDA